MIRVRTIEDVYRVAPMLERLGYAIYHHALEDRWQIVRLVKELKGGGYLVEPVTAKLSWWCFIECLNAFLEGIHAVE